MAGLTAERDALEARAARETQANHAAKAREYALRLLGLSDRSVEELACKLRARGFAEDVVRDVLDEMKSLGYLDDERCARHFAEVRATERGLGPARIRAELERRGFSRELAESATAGAFAERSEEEAALALARDWASRARGGSGGSPGDPATGTGTARRRLWGVLARHGFSPEVAERVVREVLG